MTIKNALERLKYTHRAIESYEGMKQQTIALYETVDYKSATLKRMIEYTNKRIEEEQTHHDYWQNLITELADDRYRDILTMRYIDDVTTEKVADDLFYTVTHTYRLSKQAINALTQAHHEG